jgi:hypothetical protein
MNIQKLLFAILFLLFARTTSACSCIGESAIAEAFKHADAVFHGTVLSVDTIMQEFFQDETIISRYAKLRVNFRVIGSYKLHGKSDTVSVMTGVGGGDCGFYFIPGTDYIVYADREDDKQLHTNICMRTKGFEPAEDSKLHGLSKKRRNKRNGAHADFRQAGLPAEKVYGVENPAANDPCRNNFLLRR